MLNATRELLGAFILKPALLEAVGNGPIKELLSDQEWAIYEAILAIWEDSRPSEGIPLGILADRLRGKVRDPATITGGLVDGAIRSSLTPEAVRMAICGLRKRKLAEKILRLSNRLSDGVLKTDTIDDKEMNQLVCRIIEWEILSRGAGAESTPNLIQLDGIAPEPVEWLWPGRIPKGKVTLLSGDPGTGKSYFAMDLVARITSGRPAPDGLPLEQGACLILAGEDGLADTLRVRADRLGADSSKIVVLDGLTEPGGENKFFRFDEHLDAFESAIRSTPMLRLIVIDPIASFLGKLDANKQGDARAVMDPLARLAERHRLSTLILAHLNKAATNNAVYRTSGSQQWPAAARAVFYLAEDNDPESKSFGRKILDSLKMNLAKKPHKLSFVIGDLGPCDYKIETDDHRSADEILQPTIGGGGGARARQQAATWLQGKLRDGPRPKAEIEDDAKEAGIAWATLRRAKDSLGVDSYPARDTFPKKWYWMLPAKVSENEHGGSVAHDEQLEQHEQHEQHEHACSN